MECPSCKNKVEFLRIMSMTAFSAFVCPRCGSTSRVRSAQMALVSVLAGTPSSIVLVALTYKMSVWSLVPAIFVSAIFIGWSIKVYCELDLIP